MILKAWTAGGQPRAQFAVRIEAERPKGHDADRSTVARLGLADDWQSTALRRAPRAIGCDMNT
jgi:hypothetical protein